MLGIGTAGPIGPGAQGAAEAARSPGRGLTRVERDAWVVLSAVDGLGPATFARLLRAFGSAAAILATANRTAGAEQLLAVAAASSADGDEAGSGRWLDPKVAAGIVVAASQRDRIVGRVDALGLAVITLEDVGYPPRLLSIRLPPHVLFVRGEAEALRAAHAVAVVGTRRPTEEGRTIASRIGAALVRAGAVVVSGLAVGIDGAVHAAVVEERGQTVGVIAGGHGRLYPRAHRRLAERIVAEGGAIVSEMAPDVPPMRGLFPRRNRLISGLSDATIITEAARRSGALITAAWALEQGRGCYVVPGSLGSRTAEGCLAFLRAFPDLVRVVAGVSELVEDLRLPGAGDVRTASPTLTALVADMSPTERVLAAALARGRATADELVGATGLPVGTVLGGLTLLEMRGLIVSAYGVYRAAGRLATIEEPAA